MSTERSAAMSGEQPLVFAHANSYGASTYRVLFAELARRGFEVFAPEQLGHDPRYPVTSNWPHLVQELVDAAHPWLRQQAQPAWWVGHSMGGYLCLMAAALHPQQVRGVVLLDAPLLAGWRAQAVRWAKHAQWVQRWSPAAVSRKRRNRWPDLDAVRVHFQSKRSFARWHPEVLEDYVTHGTVATDQGRALRFTREVETAIYDTLPHHLQGFLRRHRLRVPVAFIGGLQSSEIRQVGLNFTRQVCHGRLTLVDGSHLFPMEQPRLTAAAVEAACLNLQQRPPPDRPAATTR